MTIYELADQQRERLLANDKSTRDTLIQAYATADRDLQRRCASLMDLIERRREAGEEVSRAWLLKEARYDALLSQVSERIKTLAGMTASETTKAARANLRSGTRDALALIEAASGRASVAGALDRLNTKATENIAAYMDTNAPLGRLLARIGEEMPTDAVKAAKDVLLVGVATGQNPRVVAKNFQAATGQSLTRSLTIARTEQLRAYRQASLQIYQESDVISGWQWLCTKSARTCVACLAQDGKLYDKASPFPAHVRCRCTTVPVVGQPRSRQTGEEWLKAQDADTQNTIMGPAAATAWRKGEVMLSDFVGVRKNPDWGASVYHDSLKGARERAAIRAKTGTIKVGNDGSNGAKDASAGPLGTAAKPYVFVGGEARRLELEALAQKELDAIAPIVSDAVGLPSNWSGVVRVDLDLTDRGVKHWDCPISLSPETMESAGADRHRVQIHEMLHAHSVGFVRKDFIDNRGFEEACVEQLQRLIRGRVYDAAGFGAAPAYGDARDREHIYNVYIAALEKVRVFYGDEPIRFYADLLGQPIASRKAVLLKRALTDSNRREAINVCGKAGSVLMRDLNDEDKAGSARLAAEVEQSAAYLFDGDKGKSE